MSLLFPLAGCVLACGCLFNQYQLAVSGELQAVQLALMLNQHFAAIAEQLAAVQQWR